MFTKLKNWLLGIEHNVESIVANLWSHVTALEDHAVAQVKQAEQHAAAAAKAIEQEAAARLEVGKALNVANNIKALLS
jgi:hypothetical protein